MYLNVKFLQVLFIIYISFESINFGDSDKIIPIFLMSKNTIFENKHCLFFLEYIFASAAISSKYEAKSRQLHLKLFFVINIRIKICENSVFYKLVSLTLNVLLFKILISNSAYICNIDYLYMSCSIKCSTPKVVY